MKTPVIYVTRFAYWAPDPANPAGSPGLEFTTPLFRRRLSQISRMTIQVVHDLTPIKEDTKIVFVSFRGEIAQQFKVNKMLIEEGDISPAAFSQSVFNTPPALAAIALDLRAGYTAIYPAGDRFDTGFLAAASPILCGDADETLFVYADEFVPAEYGNLCPRCNEALGTEALDNEALAFAALLSRTPCGLALPVPEKALESPRTFLKYLREHNDKG